MNPDIVIPPGLLFFLNFLFGSDIQQFGDIREVDVQIIINTGLYSIGKAIVPDILGFEIVHGDALPVRIDNPIFTDASGTIFKELCEIVHTPAAGRYNFDYPVRSTGTSSVGELVRGTNNRDIRFDIVSIILIQKYRKGSKKGSQVPPFDLM